MACAQALFLRMRETVIRRFRAQSRAQTIIEYALILASIGVVAWGAYNVMGHDIGSMTSGLDSDLTSA
jgi:Flp pilus assembly pilin Flp